MKIKLILLGFFSTFLGFAQTQKKYLMLDDLAAHYQVKKYTLNTQSLYGIDSNIEMYNVFGQGLMLLSVLPDLDTGKNWQQIDISEVQKEVFTVQEVYHLFRDLLSAPQPDVNLPATKSIYKYKLIKKENDVFYVSTHCLFEYFKEVNYPAPIRVSGTDVLNLEQPLFTIKQMKELWQRPTFNQRGFPMEYGNLLPDSPNLESVYLSDIKIVSGEKLYRFWMFAGWNVQDGYNDQRGIERFAYIPNKGIVGGSYDFYFRFEPKYPSAKRIRVKLSAQQWKENMYEEKIMWAKELFPDR